MTIDQQPEVQDLVRRAREYEFVLVRTYRYLRLSMMAMVVFLFVAIAIERGREGQLLGSISAYYWTGVHAVFIAALCSIGVSLVVYRGYTETEDVLLNAAGFLAFVVALVPTGPPTGLAEGLAVHPFPTNAVKDNVTAMLILGGASMLFSGWLMSRWQPSSLPGTPGYADERLDRKRSLGAFAFVSVGFVGVVVARDAAADYVAENGHWLAASTMFGLIGIVVGVHAVRTARRRPGGLAKWSNLVNVSTAVVLLMVAAALAFGVAVLTGRGAGHRVLFIEAAEISLFAVFWIAQTREHWSDVWLLDAVRYAVNVAPGPEYI